MLMDGLPLVVIVRMKLPVWPRDRLRRFVSLEAHVERSLAIGELLLAETLVAEHQVVVRLQILGIDEKHLRELGEKKRFLPVLFCSPTMELGVDIADLSAVNLRNVPENLRPAAEPPDPDYDPWSA